MRRTTPALLLVLLASGCEQQEAVPPGAYAEASVSVFSWEDSVMLGWLFLVPVAGVALLELRLAAACWTRRPWAAWGAGLQLGVLALAVASSALPSA